MRSRWIDFCLGTLGFGKLGGFGFFFFFFFFSSSSSSSSFGVVSGFRIDYDMICLYPSYDTYWRYMNIKMIMIYDTTLGLYDIL